MTSITPNEARNLLRQVVPVTVEVTMEKVYEAANQTYSGQFYFGVPVLDGEAEVVVGYSVAQSGWYKQLMSEVTL